MDDRRPTIAIRPLNLPKDFVLLEGLFVRIFQYPENPEWSIQADDEEDDARVIKMLRRLWPIIRGIQVISPALRDMIRGFLWEEDGQIGGCVITQRDGTANTWKIAVVGVLPEFRRRGLARKLVTQTLDDLRQRGAKRIVLSVIDRNVPAYSLYNSLGFDHYSSSIAYRRDSANVPETCGLARGLEEASMSTRDWKSVFRLEKAIAPEHVTRYEPVEAGQFGAHIALRALEPLMDRLLRQKQGRFLYRREGVTVGYLTYRTPGSGKGTSFINARPDPSCEELAPYLLTKAMRAVIAVNPTLRIRTTVPSWLPQLAEAAQDLGFTECKQYHKLGLIL